MMLGKVYVVIYIDGLCFSDAEVFGDKEKAEIAFMNYTGITWDWNATSEENNDRLLAHNEEFDQTRIIERIVIC